MQFVDDVSMGVIAPAMLSHMRMVGGQFRVLVSYFGGIMFRPAPERQQNSDDRQNRKSDEGGSHSETSAHLPGDRIGDQPTDMAQGKLRGKKGRPVRFRR